MLYGKVTCNWVRKDFYSMFEFGGNDNEDYPMARMFRDARIGTIELTSEIMRDIIAKL